MAVLDDGSAWCPRTITATLLIPLAGRWMSDKKRRWSEAVDWATDGRYHLRKLVIARLTTVYFPSKRRRVHHLKDPLLSHNIHVQLRVVSQIAATHSFSFSQCSGASSGDCLSVITALWMNTITKEWRKKSEHQMPHLSPNRPFNCPLWLVMSSLTCLAGLRWLSMEGNA